MSGNPFSVSYRSRGGLLVFGDRAALEVVLPLLPKSLKVLAVVKGASHGLSAAGQIRIVPGNVIDVRGHLGCYRASAAGPEGALDLGPLSPNRDGLFDLVLDLYNEPLIEHEVPPLGYARCRQGKDNPVAKLERLEKLVGEVNKPRYFNFDEQRCAHDRLELGGCRRCLEACPAGAIASDKEGIRIDPYLCRGCGSCALVCPTGAASYAKPTPKVSLRHIADRLDSAEKGIDAPVLLIKASSSAITLPEEVAALEVTAVGSIGMELWLAALALGASRVVILRSGLLPPTTDRLLGQQVELARRLLKSAGQAPERIRLVNDPQHVDWQGMSNSWSPMRLGDLSGYKEKRQLLLAALGHIADQQEMKGESMPGVPFGRIGLHVSACTLCHACSRICPTAALRQRDGGLALNDADCVQCGLCVAACPENALTADPGIYPDTLVDGGEHLLKANTEAFHCVQCGKAFSSRALVEGSIAHVSSHPMFQGEGIALLKMCTECRQKATMGINPESDNFIL